MTTNIDNDIEEFMEWVKIEMTSHLKERGEKLNMDKPFKVTLSVEWDGKKTCVEHAAFNT